MLLWLHLRPRMRERKEQRIAPQSEVSAASTSTGGLSLFVCSLKMQSMSLSYRLAPHTCPGRPVRPRIGSFLLAFLFLFLSPPSVHAEDLYDLHKLVDDARLTLMRFLKHPSTSRVSKRLVEAKGIMIIPRLTEASYVIGGYGGSGVFLLKDGDSGAWSDPVFFRVTGVSLGLQLGAATSEMVTFVMSEKGVEKFRGGSFRLGTGAGLALGTVGGGFSRGGRLMRSDMVTIASSSGALVSLALGGSSIDARDKANELYYGQQVKPEEIVMNSAVTNWYSDRLRHALDTETAAARETKAAPDVDTDRQAEP